MAMMKEIFGYLQQLKDGNEKYLTTETALLNVSPRTREKTAMDGQAPYAVIITCSDSRIIPEAIFSAGIGELFVIRTAGNTIDGTTLGSIEYAVGHLGVKLIVVLGHTHCGAVEAAICNKHEEHEYEEIHAEEIHGNLSEIIEEISKAIGQEQDSYRAVKLNVEHGCSVIQEHEFLAIVIGAIYHTASGKVEFLQGNLL